MLKSEAGFVGRATETRQRLVEAALGTLAEEGIAGTSARTIAGRAGVNQALVFYHFGTVDGLLAEASRVVSAERAAVYAERLADVGNFTDLVRAARDLHQEERAAGNLAVLAQLLAGAATHPGVVATLRGNFELLAGQVTAVLERLIAGTPLDGLLATDQLARSIAGGFLGLELMDALAPEHDPTLFDQLDALAVVADALLEAGALQRGLLRRRLRGTQTAKKSK
jgi:AcrR family transcriptional regulator